jgi:hypothetical protein
MYSIAPSLELRGVSRPSARDHTSTAVHCQQQQQWHQGTALVTLKFGECASD